MSSNGEVRTYPGGFGREDFDLLQRIGEDDPLSDDARRGVDLLWIKARRLADALAARLFGPEGFHATVWPDGEDGERGPFLWIRCKRAGNEGYATHIGVFLSPGFCNLALDLEKDPIEAGEAAEAVDQVLDFYRNEGAGLIDPPARPDLHVWTDAENVVPATGFAGVDFDAFMEDNRDAGHPWPKAGYLLSTDDVAGFGDDWVAECHARAVVLLPIYDAMIRSFQG